MAYEDDDNPFAVFAVLISAHGGGGDRNNAFPASDALDVVNGARFIPGEVTLARRAGSKVQFVQSCTNQCCWYWLMPNGDKIYHWDRNAFDAIAQANGMVLNDQGAYEGGAGPCPHCGNTNTSGGTVKA